MQFTNKEKATLINHLGKMSCLLLFHASNSSFQSPAESLIENFRRFWERAGYHKLNCDLFQLNTLVSLTNMSLNRRPLFLLRTQDNDILELCSQDLFSGRDRDFPRTKHISTLSPLSPENVLAQISQLAANANLAFQELHSERFVKLISFYKNNKVTEYTKVLSRPLEVGDVCLVSRRDDPVLRLCVIIELSDPGIEGYSDSSEAKIAFLADKSAGIKDSLKNLRKVWKRKTMRVNVANLAPILAHDQLSADLTVLDDFEVPLKTMDKVNDVIDKLPHNLKQKFWSKLSNSSLFTAPLSRILLNEKSSDPPTDPYYLASRNLRAGIVLPPPSHQDNVTPIEILKNILPPADFLPPSSTDTLSSTLNHQAIPDIPVETNLPDVETESKANPVSILPDSVPEPLLADPTAATPIEPVVDDSNLTDHPFTDDLADPLPLAPVDKLDIDVEDSVLKDLADTTIDKTDTNINEPVSKLPIGPTPAMIDSRPLLVRRSTRSKKVPSKLLN